MRWGGDDSLSPSGVVGLVVIVLLAVAVCAVWRRVAPATAPSLDVVVFSLLGIIFAAFIGYATWCGGRC